MEIRNASLNQRCAELESQGKLLEVPPAAPAGPSTTMEMLRELGFCSGIRETTRGFPGRPAGRATAPLLPAGLLPRRLRVLHRRVPPGTVPAAGGGCTRATVSAQSRRSSDYGFRLGERGSTTRPGRRSRSSSRSRRRWVVRVLRTPGRLRAHALGRGIVEADRPAHRDRRPRGRGPGRPATRIDDLMNEIRGRASSATSAHW